MRKTARMLLILTVAYNVVEGVIAIWSGVKAQSLALIGFGADSYLEVGAATLVLWRLGKMDSEEVERSEQRATRFIGWTFVLLAVAIVTQSIWNFAYRFEAEESVFGIGLALASVLIMPGLALWKLNVAKQEDIQALAIEAKETLACSYLSLTLLIGLLANATFGWWWLDTTTALLLTPWLIKEGLEGIRGEEHGE